MEKIKSKINDISGQHCVKTEIVTQADFEAIKRTLPLSLEFIGGILILLFSMTGCSDMPYTGPILTAEDVVNQYLVSSENSFCLHDGVESACITLAPRERRAGVDNNAPIIHIHPRKLIYVFYHEGKQIIHAERVMDTTEIVEALTAEGADPVLPSLPPQVRTVPPPPPPVTNPPILVTNPSPPPPPPITNPPRVNPPNNGGGNNGGGNNGGGNNGGNNGGTPQSRTATTLEVVSGDGQSAETNQHLTNPLIVRVLDQNRAALSGVTVSFTVSPSGGVLNPTSATTGSNGEASTALQFGSTAGTYTVTASASGLSSVRFTATATEPPRAATLEVVSGNNQSGETDQLLTNPLIVRVLDQNSAVLSGVTVSFTVSPSGVLNPTSDTTDSDGEASTVLQLGSTVDTYTVTASVSGLSSVTFTATATEALPPLPSRIATTLEVVSGDNQSDQINQHLMDPLVVKVLDQDRAALSGVTVTFTVNPSDGVLSPTSATTDADGQASTALQFGNTAGTYTVTASASGLSSVTFTVTATQPPRPARLEKVSGDGQSKEAYQYLTNPLVVKVIDQYGDPLSDVPVSFTVNPSSGVLIPASTTTGSNGQASTLLRFSKTTGTYTVTAGASGIAQSVTFTATATERATDSDWAQQSHYYDEDQSKQGWLVWIYYPENYKGPRETPGESGEADFLSNGFMLIPSDGATVTEFTQTDGPCYDADKPCHIGTAGDSNNSTTYSVQIFLSTTQDQTSFRVIWDRRAGNWDGSPPPDMIYSLMASKNTMLYTNPMYDPDHTKQ